jgi:N4-(beta-N-acetylglucosaminyl)-L-asparaginase
MAGSANALEGMQRSYARLVEGADPLDVAIEVVKVVEADPKDSSVGLGGLPNEDGVVQLDAAVMHGPTHNAGAVACLENILHPCEVARLVMERTDHVLLVGRGAYEFARAHGHPHVELLTEEARRAWLEWKETMSERDDRLPPRPAHDEDGGGGRARTALADWPAGRVTGTVHCSALSVRGEVGCTTTTSGLAWKIPGRVGDSPIVGAGLFCDQEGGSAGCTGRGEAAILSTAAASAVALLGRGASPLEAGMEVLERVTRQTRRLATWQRELLDEAGLPAFGLRLYLLALDGRHAGVSLRGGGTYAAADPDGGPRLVELAALHP